MIKEICIADSGLWDDVVRSFSDYEVFYLSGYSQAFKNEAPKNGEPILLLYENGRDRAINVVLKRDVALDDKLRGKVDLDHYYDLITPYGYGGFWGTITDWDKLNQDYNKYCIDNHYVCEFVRFELFNDYYTHYDGEVESRTHNVIRSLEMPLEEIWMDFKQKVRKNVKKANTYNLNCVIEDSDDHLDDFLHIYYGTMERTDAQKDFFFSKHFFEKLNEMKGNVMYFHVLYEGRVISTELVIYGADNCYSYLGGTEQEFFYVRPNDYLKYEIIKWAKDKGLKNFILGGGYGSDDGIFQYKSCLAPHGINDFYIGRKIFDNKAYKELVCLRDVSELNDGYFPLYRS